MSAPSLQPKDNVRTAASTKPVGSADPILAVRHLTREFELPRAPKHRRVIRAVDDVSFEIRAGETLGLVGESGSGKTTTARCILRAIEPTRGEIRFRMRDGQAVELSRLPERKLRPLRREMQMVFQDPQASLDPRMTVKDIVGEPLLVHGLATQHQLRARVAEILQKVGLKPEHMERFPAAFSTGQRQRIGIARALVMQPSFVVADEPVSTLDVSVQAQVLNLLKDLQAELRLTYLFVAHNLDVVRHFCDRVAVMYAGRVVELAETRELFANPRHPYTRALLAAAPVPDPDAPFQMPLVGEGADNGALPFGCAFQSRCGECTLRCRGERPNLIQRGNALVACHLYSGL
ncbi:peptide ABC transporter ATP-binding protein [Opitutaceae bacterium EW11]|nr:peptide ABC transporter ATP-binding protein [Opitutaceae bacterium EW11]